MEPPHHVRLALPAKGKPWTNPGVALYEHWSNTLDDFLGTHAAWNGHGASMMYGASPGFGIGWVREHATGGSLPAGAMVTGQRTKLNIAFGFVGSHGTDATSHGAGTQFIIRADGSFLLGHMHGEHLRNIIARNTFLGWSYFHGQYHWQPYFTGHSDVGRYYHGPMDKNFLRQPWVPERVVRAYAWNKYGWWSKLVDTPSPSWPKGNGEFELAFAENFNPTQGGDLDGATRYAKFVKTRERRIRAAENRDLIERGLLTPRQSAQRLTEEQRQERIEADSERMANLMVVR